MSQPVWTKPENIQTSLYHSIKSMTFDGVVEWMVNFNILGVSTFPIRRFNSVSVSMWVKAEGGPGFPLQQIIVSRWFPFDGLILDEGGWRWYLWDAPLTVGAMVFQVSTHALEGLWVYSQTAFPLDQWVHVVMTYDGSSTISTSASSGGLKMFWDGVWQPLHTIWGTWTTNALNSNAFSHLLWGAQYTAFPGGVGPVWPPVIAHFFEGRLDESCFWRHTLDTNEVLALHNNGHPVNPMHVGLPNKPADRYFRMGEVADGTPWILPGSSISWCRNPVTGTLSNGFWNNDGATPPLRVVLDSAP